MSFTMDFTSMTPQQIKDLAKPTKEYEEVMQVWPPLKINWSNIPEAVAKLRVQTEIADEMDEQDSAVHEETTTFRARDGHALKLRIFKSRISPSSSSKPRPLVVLYHGGGWVLGSPTMVAPIARNIVKAYNCIVIAPSYRLTPEHPWPTPLNDGWDALQHIRTNDFGANPSKGFIIGGISAGATMSLIYAHRARDEAFEPKITGIWSACGSIRPQDPSNLEEKYQSRYISRTQEECINNPILSKEMTKLMADCVKITHDDTSHPLLELSHKDLAPRVYQQICGRDYSRDEGLIFDDMLKKEEEGIETRLDVYAGLPHCFWIALTYIPEYKKWERDTMEGFRWLLGK